MIKLSRRKNTIRGGMPIEKDIECPEITTLKKHKGPLDCIAFNPSGNLLATGSWDKTVKLWLIKPDGSIDLKPASTLNEHIDSVNSVAFHPTMLNILATGSDRTVRFWRFKPEGSAEQTPVATLKWHSGSVESVTFHPTLPLMATGSYDNTAMLWRFNSDGSAATPIAALEGHSDDVNSATFHPTAPLLATCSYDRTVKLWRFQPDGSAETLISTLEGHSRAVWSVAFHPTLPLLATCSNDMTAKLWRVNPDGSAEQTPVATLEGHSGSVFSVAFHPTIPNLLATCSYDKTVKLWRFRDDGSGATPVATLAGHRERVSSVAFHPTAPLLATCSYDRTAKLWDISRVLEYLRNQRKIAITRAFLTSRLLQAFTTTQTTINIPRIKLSNEVQGRVGNPPNLPYQSDNNAKQSKIKSIKYLEFPRTDFHVPSERLTSKSVDSSVSSPSFVQLQPSEVLTSSSSALSDGETPSVSSFCRLDDTSCEALYESIPWKQLLTMPGSCREAADILEKLKQLKRLLTSQEKPTGLTDRWIKLLEEKISSCNL